MRAKQYRFTTQDIADAVQWPKRHVYRAIREGWFNPKSFWSTYSFVETTRLSNSLAKEVK